MAVNRSPLRGLCYDKISEIHPSVPIRDSDNGLEAWLLSHGKYSIYQPVEMNEDNKELFNKILNAFLEKHKFQLPEIFTE